MKNKIAQRGLLVAEISGVKIYQTGANTFESTMGHVDSDIDQIIKRVKTAVNLSEKFAAKY
jgi:hypothetical protein